MTQRYPTEDRTGLNPHHGSGTTSEQGRTRKAPRPVRRPPARSTGSATAPGTGAPADRLKPRVATVIDGAATDDYVAHTSTLRGVVRQRLVTRALLEHLPPAPGRILDIGGGNGVQALALAERGYEVTVCEPAPRMLDEAKHAVAQAPEVVQRRIRLVHGDGLDAARLVGGEWDATLCHGVIMFVPEPAALLNVLADVTRPGGIISVVGKNGPALALRAGLQGRWHDVRTLLDEGGGPGDPVPPPHRATTPPTSRPSSRPRAPCRAPGTASGRSPTTWATLRSARTSTRSSRPSGPPANGTRSAASPG